MSCRRKDDIPTQLPMHEGLAHEESVVGNCDRQHHDKCKCLSHLGKHKNRELSSRPREHNITLTAILCQCRSVCSRRVRAKANMARMQGSKTSKSERRRSEKCYHCREAGHAKSQRRKRLKDLADAEGKPMTANSRPNNTSTIAPLASDYVKMHLVTMPHVKRKPSCACVKIKTTMNVGCGQHCSD